MRKMLLAVAIGMLVTEGESRATPSPGDDPRNWLELVRNFQWRVPDLYGYRTLMRWGFGGGKPLLIVNNINVATLAIDRAETKYGPIPLDWTTYMESNPPMRSKLIKAVGDDARHRTVSGPLNPTDPNMPGLVVQLDDGYITGYQHLHGTNDLRVEGWAEVTPGRDGSRVITYHLRYLWHDRIDPMEQLTYDAMLAQLAKRLRPNATDYDIEILWQEIAQVRVASEGRIVAAQGYPFDPPDRKPSVFTWTGRPIVPQLWTPPWPFEPVIINRARDRWNTRRRVVPYLYTYFELVQSKDDSQRQAQLEAERARQAQLEAERVTRMQLEANRARRAQLEADLARRAQIEEYLARRARLDDGYRAQRAQQLWMPPRRDRQPQIPYVEVCLEGSACRRAYGGPVGDPGAGAGPAGPGIGHRLVTQ